MADNKEQQLSRITAYARLLEKQAGKAVRPYRADGFVNLLNRWGTSKDSSEAYHFVREGAVPDEVLSDFYEGNGLFAKIVDAPAEEALRYGFTLKDVSDQEVEDFFEEALDALDWTENAMTAIKWARLFGGSLAVMLIDDGNGLEEPLDWKHIKSIDDIRVYDRSLVQIDETSRFRYDPTDPLGVRGSRLGMPEFFQVNSQYGSFVVHESRCLPFQNGILPEHSSNSLYRFWGVPEYIRINKAIQDAEISHRSAPKMLNRSVQPVYKMKDLAAELATEQGETNVLKRLQTIDLARGMMNSITIDSEGEDYDFRTFQFAGVSDVIDSACNFLSALTNIPQTILFGRSPTGMNSTGHSDLENWYNYVGRIQQRMLRKNLRYLLSIIFQAGVATGEVDEIPKLKIEFNPLWSLSESEKADLEQKKAVAEKTKAETAQIYVDMQALDPSEVRNKLAGSSEFDVETILDEEMLDEGNEGDDILNAYVELMQEGESASEGMAGADVTAQTENTTENPAKGPENVDSEKEDTTFTSEAKGGSVGVIVVKDGKVLTGVRHNDFGYGLICGPGGHIDGDETPEEAAIRETEEEFSIKPLELIPIGMGPLEPDTGLRPYLYLCTEYEGEPASGDLEMVNPKFRDLDELADLDASLFQPFRDGIKQLEGVLNGTVHADEGWVTINGTHCLIDDDGIAMSGGKLKGANFGKAKSQKKPSPTAGGSSGTGSEEEGNERRTRWRKRLTEEREERLSEDPMDQALSLYEAGYMSEDDAVAAGEDGSISDRTRDYFDLMEKVGDNDPDKPTSQQLATQLRKDVKSGKYPGYIEAREGYVSEMTGMSAEEAQKTCKEFRTWFGGGWKNADTATIDKYVEEDHAYEGEMYRGMRLGENEFKSFMENIKPGAVIRNKDGRNSSWSNNKEVAHEFAYMGNDEVSSVMMVCKKNRTSAPIAHLSTLDEGEIISHSKTEWVVVGAEMRANNKAVITVVERGV